jgi:uncharacterized membrane protein YraQ (UPF0718 family)
VSLVISNQGSDVELLVSFFTSTMRVVGESAPFLLVGFFLAGIFRAAIPEQWVIRMLGADRFRSVFLASLFGVPLPLCSCSVIPAVVALRQKGASRGASASFLISTPETGVDSISITYALMDPIMTIARPVAAFVTALVTGSMVNIWGGEETGEEAEAAAGGEGGSGTGIEAEATASCSCGDGCAEAIAAPQADAVVETSCGCEDTCHEEELDPERSSPWRSLRDGVRYAFGPLMDDLAIWLLLGFAVSGAIVAFIPEGLLEQIPSGWISSGLMVIIGTPVYICASAATPVAAALIAKGLDPGAALVLLLVGPATNATTILVVMRFMGRRILAIYLVGVAASALLAGFIINSVYNAATIDTATSVPVSLEEPLTPLKIVAAIVLIGLLMRSALRGLSVRPEVTPAEDLSGS